ncbi:hypothetical protein [Aquiflexum lacus]|uniref:hypothetical protein n=1 Tax=Aquiflexum lacus TaxID=2483805 RepID=UPI001893CC80|nr:hypothetical protein [Aquiflexum lacus]
MQFKKKVNEIWVKIRKVVLEVAIVFFGVLFAALIADYHTKSIEQKEVKDFLISLSDQIYEDVMEVDVLIGNFQYFESTYIYLSEVELNDDFRKTQFDSAFTSIQSNDWLNPNVSLYEGFKSSGKLSNIQNKDLMFNILYFYQEALPRIKASENGWLRVHQRLRDYILDNTSYEEDGTLNNKELIIAPKGKIITKTLIPSPQLFGRYRALQELGKEIIFEINKEYDLSPKYKF